MPATRTDPPMTRLQTDRLKDVGAGACSNLCVNIVAEYFLAQKKGLIGGTAPKSMFI